MKKPMTIEKLLEWAFRDELPKQAESAHGTNWLGRLQELGTRIDDQLGPAIRYPANLGEPHADAITLGRMVADIGRDAKRTGGQLWATEALLVMHASMGTRPDCLLEPVRVLPVRDGSRVRIVGKNKGKHNGRPYYSEGSYCPLAFEPRLQDIAHARAEYRVWHNALLELVIRCNTGELLTEHLALAPSSPPSPWIDSGKKMRVLKTLDQPLTEIEKHLPKIAKHLTDETNCLTGSAKSLTECKQSDATFREPQQSAAAFFV